MTLACILSCGRNAPTTPVGDFQPNLMFNQWQYGNRPMDGSRWLANMLFCGGLLATSPNPIVADNNQDLTSRAGGWIVRGGTG